MIVRKKKIAYHTHQNDEELKLCLTCTKKKCNGNCEKWKQERKKRRAGF